MSLSTLFPQISISVAAYSLPVSISMPLCRRSRNGSLDGNYAKRSTDDDAADDQPCHSRAKVGCPPE